MENKTAKVVVTKKNSGFQKLIGICDVPVFRSRNRKRSRPNKDGFVRLVPTNTEIANAWSRTGFGFQSETFKFLAGKEETQIGFQRFPTSFDQVGTHSIILGRMIVGSIRRSRRVSLVIVNLTLCKRAYHHQESFIFVKIFSRSI